MADTSLWNKNLYLFKHTLVFTKEGKNVSHWNISELVASCWHLVFIWFADNADQLLFGEVRKSRNVLRTALGDAPYNLDFCHGSSWRILWGLSLVFTFDVLVVKLCLSMDVLIKGLLPSRSLTTLDSMPTLKVKLECNFTLLYWSKWDWVSFRFY